jgi:hypothetical protein
MDFDGRFFTNNPMLITQFEVGQVKTKHQHLTRKPGDCPAIKTNPTTIGQDQAPASNPKAR